MSKWVRLIGGPNNGEVVKVDDDQPYLHKTETTPLPAVRSHRALSLSSSVTSVVRTSYTRRTVRSSNGEIIFFALEGLTDFEALNQVLGP